MNNIIILLFGLLIITLTIIYLKKIYNDKFVDVPASIIYLKAPTKNLIQPLEKQTTYSCGTTKCSPNEEGFNNVSIEKFTVQDDINVKLNDIEELINNINGNMQTIYINLISYYNKDNLKIKDPTTGNDYNPTVTQNKYINNYINTFNNNINQIGSSIDYLENILGIRENVKESFVTLPSVDKNKMKEVTGYVIFS